MLRNKPSVIYLDTEGNQYDQHFYIYTKGLYDSWKLEKSADSAEEAKLTAKKYVHISDVRIEVNYTRTYLTLPKVPVCT
jgi:hypothetical protein